jgi:hypothetical protein
MSDENKFKHHEYLQTVADEDVRFVLDKDRSYGASWKKRGGVGAFMMLARKWDRLETMLSETPVTSGRGVTFTKYDIFSLMALQEDATSPREPGRDGSVLAEVRDLRRYLLNVEAEMMARGVVRPPLEHHLPEPTPGPTLQELEKALERVEVMPGEQPVLDTAVLVEKVKSGEIPGYPDVQIVGASDKPQRQVPRGVPERTNLPDADDSRHASLVPWAVSMRWRYKHDMQPGGARAAEFDKWWRVVVSGTWALEPSVCASSVPRELHGLYTNFGLWWTANIADCPPHAREWFPRLRRTLNKVEYDALPAWQATLYDFSTERDTGGEYVLRELHADWCAGVDEAAA